MRHILFALLALVGTSFAGSETSLDPARTELVRRLDLLDLYGVDGGIGACMEVRESSRTGDTVSFELARKSAPCPAPVPSRFQVVLSTGAVLEASRRMPLEQLVQSLRRDARHEAPAWSRPPSDPVCGDDPDCSYISAGGGGSLRKR